MAETDNSVNTKNNEDKTQVTVDKKTNGESEEMVVDAKSPVKQSPLTQSPLKRAADDSKQEESQKIQSPKKQKQDELNKDDDNQKRDEDEESESDEELPLGSLEGPVQIMEGKRERKKVQRLSLEQKETPEKKKFEIVEGQGTKLGEMERVEMILNKTNADQLKFLYRFLFGRVGKLFEIKKHIRQFSGFNFTENDSDFDKKEQFLIKLTMTALKDFCSYLDLERGGTKDVVMKRILDFCLNPVASGRKVPKKKTAVKRKRSSSGKEKSEKKSKKPKKEKPAKVSSETVDDGDISDVSSISSISSDSENEQKEAEKTQSKPKKTKTKKLGSDHGSQGESIDEEVKSPKKKKAKEAQKKTPVSKKKAKVEKKKTKEEKKKSPKKSETPKKSESPKKKVKTKDYVVSSDSDSSDGEPILKKKKHPTDSELKSTIETLLEKANLEEITMKAFCKQVYAQYPDFDLKHKKDFIKTTVKNIVS